MVSERQAFAMNSTGKYGSTIDDKHELLRGTGQWDLNDERVKKALELIGEELEIKLSYFTQDISPNDTSDMEGYTYRDFCQVYEGLLYLALYERSYSASNKIIV